MLKKLKVTYQGIAGAYSHLACYNYFGKDIECIGTETFEDAMQLVEDNEADFALIPIENKTAGRVDEFYGLIPQMKLQIVGEHYQKINHYLMGVEESKLSDIKYAYSHPQGLAQCRENLKKLNIKPIAQFDTAGSAREVSRLKDKTIGAVASFLAGEIYGLKILKADIQDHKDNFTRFIILANRREIEIRDDREYITSIIFKIQNIPSALYKAIGGFAKNQVNILKIESYIPLGKLRESRFHIDIDGSIKNKAVRDSIDILKHYVNKFKILGIYEKNRVIIDMLHNS
jgi:prephenate dehydratase